MAKKKAKFEDDIVSNYIINKYGDIVKSGIEVLETINSYEIISFSPVLDIALKGGIREGTVVGITGDPKTCKTSSCLHFAGKCQKLGKKVIYLNTEGRMNRQNFDGIQGLDIEALRIVESTENKIVSAEDFLNIAEYYIKNLPGCVVIVDSTSSMVPQCELEGEIRTGIRNALPRLLSMFFKRIGNSVAKNRVIAIFVTHNIANTGGGPFSPNKMADCGNMLQYQVGTNLLIKGKGKWESNDGSGQIGQKIFWEIATSNTGAKPYTKVEGWFKYGLGIDETQEIFQMACELNIIKVGGSWYTINKPAQSNDEIDSLFSSIGDGNEIKAQGGNKIAALLDEYPILKEAVYNDLRELCD